MGEAVITLHCGGRAPATTQLALYVAVSVAATVSAAGAPPSCTMLFVTAGAALVRRVLPAAAALPGCVTERVKGLGLDPQCLVPEALRRRSA